MSLPLTVSSPAPGVVMADPHWQSFMKQACPSAVLPVRVPRPALLPPPPALLSSTRRCSRLLVLDQIAEGGEMLANKDVSQFPGASQDPEEQGE